MGMMASLTATATPARAQPRSWSRFWRVEEWGRARFSPLQIIFIQLSYGFMTSIRFRGMISALAGTPSWIQYTKEG